MKFHTIQLYMLFLVAVTLISIGSPGYGYGQGTIATLKGTQPITLCLGPDGNAWVTESGSDKIARVTPAGVVTEWSVTAGSKVEGIAIGPDGALWFGEPGTAKYGEITTAGVVHEYNLGADVSVAKWLTSGPGGNI